jgi:hypothetical protein
VEALSAPPGKMIAPAILIFVLEGSKQKDKSLWTKWLKAFPKLHPFFISSDTQFVFIGVFPSTSQFHPQHSDPKHSHSKLSPYLRVQGSF